MLPGREAFACGSGWQGAEGRGWRAVCRPLSGEGFIEHQEEDAGLCLWLVLPPVRVTFKNLCCH